MLHCAVFISAYSLYMFRASSAHHQEYLKLVWRPLVRVYTSSITLVFYLTYTTMHGKTNVKFWDQSQESSLVTIALVSLKYSRHNIGGLPTMCQLTDKYTNRKRFFKYVLEWEELIRTYNLIGHCFIQRPKKLYLCTILYVYAVYSLYTFSTFFPSEPLFSQQNFKGAVHIEYAHFQNASLQNSYLLMKLSTLWHQFLRVALHIY
jgi:hypothetical protein